MKNYIDSFDHLSESEKKEVKRIRELVVKMEKCCMEYGDFHTILNALGLLTEYYMKQVEVFNEMTK